MRNIIMLSFILAAARADAGGHKAQVLKNQGNKKVHLLELYTSEGCSSCPPAEEWVSYLVGNKGVFRNFIPVVFHVDYWNYIGWQDIFSDPAYSLRQRKYGREWEQESVATPSFVLDGKLWRLWKQRPGATKFVNRPAESEGSLEVRMTSGKKVHIVYRVPGNKKRTAYIARMSEGVISNIRGGENAGRTLRHDFAVTSLQKISLIPAQPGLLQGEVLLKNVPSKLRGKKNSVAVWISEEGSQVPLQAVGGYLKN